MNTEQQDPTEQEQRLAQALSAAMRDPRTNGQRAAARESHKPRFDGTVNLGHVLSLVAMGGALLTMWTNTMVGHADHEVRIKTLEESRAEIRITMARMTENETLALRTQEQLRASLELLVKERDRQK